MTPEDALLPTLLTAIVVGCLLMRTGFRLGRTNRW